MAKKKDTTDLTEMLQEICGSDDPLLQMMKWLCEQLMEAEVTQKLNAEKSERTSERKGFRSGYREAAFNTRLG